MEQIEELLKNIVGNRGVASRIEHAQTHRICIRVEYMGMRL